MAEQDWRPHTDGFVYGDTDFAVFPGFFGSWEVWQKVNGEWGEIIGLRSFKTIDLAKAHAAKLAADRT